MRKRSRKSVIAGILLTLIMGLAVTGCENGQGNSGGSTGDNTSATTKDTEKDENESETEDLKVVRIGCPGGDGVYSMELANVAYTEGYLEEELNAVGYTAEISGLGAGAQVNEAIAAGILDIGFYGDLPAITGKSNGLDTTVIAELNANQQFGVLAVNQDIKEAKDLEGMRVIVSQGTTAQYAWEKYAEAKEIDTSKVEIINVVSDANSLLQAGEADAYITGLYVIDMLANLGVGTIVDDTTSVPDATSQYFVVATNSFISENPDAGTAIIKALIRAQEKVKEDPQSILDASASENLSAEVYAAYYGFDDSYSFLSPELTEENINRLKATSEFMLANKLIQDAVDIDSFVDTSYYEKAVAE